MQLPSVDIFVGLAFVLGIAYGFILKRDKTITTLCSVYIGLVIASNFSESLYKFFNGNSTVANQVWVRSNASLSTISIVLFLLCILFISGAINSTSSRGGDISPFEVIILSAFTMALIVSSILGFLPEPTRAHYIEISKSAHLLFQYKIWIMLGAPLTIIVLNFRRK